MICFLLEQSEVVLIVIDSASLPLCWPVPTWQLPCDVQGSKKNYNLNLPFGQASLKFHLPGQDFINCYFSLVH